MGPPLSLHSRSTHSQHAGVLPHCRLFADHMHIRPIINAVRVYNVICNTVRLIVRKV